MGSNGEDLINDDLIPKTMEEFKTSVLVKLTALSVSHKAIVTGQVEISKKIDKTNGSIDTLFGETEDGRLKLKDHIIQCPQKERVEQLERATERYDASSKLIKWVVGLVVPILAAAGGALIMYVVEVSRHFPALPK